MRLVTFGFPERVAGDNRIGGTVIAGPTGYAPAERKRHLGQVLPASVEEPATRALDPPLENRSCCQTPMRWTDGAHLADRDRYPASSSARESRSM